jgi:hypothetical protein
MCSNHNIFIQIISFKIIIHDLFLILQSHLTYFTQACVENVCFLNKCMITLLIHSTIYINTTITPKGVPIRQVISLDFECIRWL